MIDNREMQNQLFQHELATREIQKLREQNAALFTRLAELEEIKEATAAVMRRMTFSENGPPEEVPIGRKTHTFVKGDIFEVRVTYKKESDYYNPRRVPARALMLPGVVVSVDTKKLDALAKKDNRVRAAKVTGAWMKPSLSIKRLDEKEEADG